MITENFIINSQEWKQFLENPIVISIIKRYLDVKSQQNVSKFNVFKLASDLYYRENFHSDVISNFLNPRGSHGQGAVFLNAFIDMVNSLFNKNIDRFDYEHADAVREHKKIDILVRDEQSKHCIIIENKSHDATDTDRQLPKYYDAMVEEHYMIDAIVYLPMEITKTPSKDDWTADDKSHVAPLLCVLPIFNKNDACNLVDAWLKPCSTLVNDKDCIFTLRQFGDLLTTLSNSKMEIPIFEDFYNFVTDGENEFNNAIAIREMLNNFPVYLSERLLEKFKEHGINKHKPHWVFIDFMVNNTTYTIDIECEDIKSDFRYRVVIWNRDESDLPEIPCLQALGKDDEHNGRVTYFSFKEEKALVELVNQILAEAEKIK